MRLPFEPPVEPMLAKPSSGLPEGDGWLFEPKWDGFRAIVFKDGDEIYTQSRDLKPLDRYFPELAEPFRAQLPERCVLDGEIVIATDGALAFESLLIRIHPAESRVRMLAAESPASFVAWDLLALDDEDLRAVPQGERRERLASLLAGVEPPIHLTPATTDRALAADWFDRFEGAGLDGVIAKHPEHPYQPNARAMFKVKHQRTADCVVCGFRLHKTEPEAIGSLLLGLYADGENAPRWARSFGGLLPIGATASFPMARRRELLVELRPLQIEAVDHPWGGGLHNERDGNRWNPAREQKFVPLAPERVVEVRYDHMDGGFLRHPATFLRWRPDRDAASCGFDQLEQVVGFDVAEIL